MKKMKMVVCSIACFEEDVDRILKELDQLPYGVYHFGCDTRKLTNFEQREVLRYTPEEILESN